MKDGFVEVKFKALSGKEDQAGGVVWRLKDANNYYVARANALEDNVTIYHTINGRRTEKKRTSVKVAPNQWHALRVEFQGTHFAVIYDGKKVLDWEDGTFKDAGKVGVWTKAGQCDLVRRLQLWREIASASTRSFCSACCPAFSGCGRSTEPPAADSARYRDRVRVNGPGILGAGFTRVRAAHRRKG